MMLDNSVPLILTGHGKEFPDPTFPVYFYELNKYFPYTTFGSQQPEEVLAPLGIYPIHPGEKPEGDVVEPTTPILVEGIGYVQQYTARSFTEEEVSVNLATAKQALMWKLDTVLQLTYESGFSYKHGDNSEVFSMTSDNRQLLTGLYLLAMAEQDTERKFRLRTFDDKTVLYTVEEMKLLGKALMEYVSAILNKLWDYMDSIKSATEIDQLPTVPDKIEV